MKKKENADASLPLFAVFDRIGFSGDGKIIIRKGRTERTEKLFPMIRVFSQKARSFVKIIEKEKRPDKSAKELMILLNENEEYWSSVMSHFYRPFNNINAMCNMLDQAIQIAAGMRKGR